MRDREEYENLLVALGICITSRVPFLLIGAPGGGKTAVIESAALSGWTVEVVILSQNEPSDLSGLPVVQPDGTVALAPPAWAERLARSTSPSIAFFDEWTTAAPAVQAAALRPLTHYQVGALQLPATVSFGAACNPADVSTSYEMAPPTANRFCHFDWDMPISVFTESIVTGDWPSLPLYEIPATYEAELNAARALLSGYLHARQGQLSAIPQDAASRGGAFPTPRSWDYATRLLALARAVGAGQEVIRLLVAGTVGAPTAHEYLVWADAQDLPDPEALLADPNSIVFEGMRADRMYVVMQAVLGTALRTVDAPRWENAIVLCARAADAGGLDAAVPVVRALLRPGVRPAGARVPSDIKVFAGPLALAGLLEDPAA